MRFITTILFCFVCTGLFAQQPDHKSLSHALSDFDRALMSRDSVVLNYILSDKLSYGHSNGWVETKKDVIADLFNGKLIYKDIRTANPEFISDGGVASVRSVADIDVIMDGKPMVFKLKVLQVWKWENNHWVLFARQSVKA